MDYKIDSRRTGRVKMLRSQVRRVKEISNMISKCRSYKSIKNNRDRVRAKMHHNLKRNQLNSSKTLLIRLGD